MRRVLKFGAHSQVRFVRCRKIEFRFDCSVAHRNRAARGKHDFLPETHVLIWRRRIPIHPGDSQLVGVWRGDFHGHHIFCACFDKRRHIKFIAAKRANDLVRARDLFAVDPYVRAVIDSTKGEPDGFSIKLRGDFELFAIPPRDSVRTVFQHFQIGELAANRIRHARNGAQVHAEVRIFIDAVFDEHGEDGVRGGCFVPTRRVETGGRDGFGAAAHLCRGLHRPSFAQSNIVVGPRNWRRNRRGRGEHRGETHGYKETSALSSDASNGAQQKILVLRVQNHLMSSPHNAEQSSPFKPIQWRE